ncbi:hypothetical protein C0J52_22490 [Blattella germanica]|nr:hypothetical protein C0J52_22490 [Blattella germanica]
MRMYKTIVRPTFIYGCENSKKDENALNSFERKILRRILGPLNENETSDTKDWCGKKSICLLK